MKNVVLRNFAKFTGKHQCQNLFSNKVAGLKPHVVLISNQDWLVLILIIISG